MGQLPPELSRSLDFQLPKGRILMHPSYRTRTCGTRALRSLSKNSTELRQYLHNKNRCEDFPLKPISGAMRPFAVPFHKAEKPVDTNC